LIKKIGELTFNNGVLDLHYGRKSLNVSEEVMNSIVERMLKADKKLRLINGNLMTDVHLDNICHEINGLLQEKSLLSLSELANSYDIPLAMLKEIILNRIPRIINAKMHADSIYTHMYVRRQTAIIRAKIRARSTPLLLNTLLTVIISYLQITQNKFRMKKLTNPFCIQFWMSLRIPDK
jgi:hypothetical protein